MKYLDIKTFTWEPDRYLTYADERGRPFVELVNRIDEARPSTVVDLGCGPGNLTAVLARRWPQASITGLDSSPEMIAKARTTTPKGIRFEVADLREWQSETPVDVLVSNATLQWVPGHLELLPKLISQVRPAGWFGFSVPGNFDEPSHTIRRDLARGPAYAEHLTGVPSPSAHDATTYLRDLAERGCTVDAWETTYLHVLHGADPVFTWVSATGARPTLQALEPAGLRDAFEEELKRRLRVAYPDEGHGVVLPFRRVFVVAKVPG